MRIELVKRTTRWDDELAALDPERDAQRIVQTLANHVFPLEFLLALEIAQLRTFSIPSISRVLHATQQFERDGARRLDDTRAILGEIHSAGLDAPEGREMIEHLNKIHALYLISNNDYLYTLSTFIFDPVLFVARYGPRPFTINERLAMYAFYRRLGEAMKITAIPDSFNAFWAWRRDYELEHQRYAPENEAVSRGMLDAVAKLMPPALAPLLEGAVASLSHDAGFCNAIGLKKPSAALRVSVRALATLWRHASKRVNLFETRGAAETPWLAVYPTYPNGYERLRLGPKKVIALFDRQAEQQARERLTRGGGQQ